MDTDYNEKIIRVLKKLLESDFKIKNDVYLNSLLTHLTKEPENGCDEAWRTDINQYVSCWIGDAVTQWEKLGVYSAPAVLSFTLNIASYICKDEQTFVMLNSRNIFERLITLIGIKKPTTDPSVKLGYIRLISSFLDHKSGLQWIISTNYWADIMCLTLKNQTLYITKEGYRFVTALLRKSIKINESFCHNVIQLIVAPLSTNSPCVSPSAVTNVLEVRDQAIYQSLCTSLMLLTEILQLMLEDINSDNNHKVVMIFIDKFSLEQKLRSLLVVAQNEEFVFDLYKLLFLITMFELYDRFSGKKIIDVESASDKSSKVFNIFSENVHRGSVINILKLTYTGYIYWQCIGRFMPTCVRNVDDPVPLLFENQLLMLQLFPIISVSLRLLGEKEAEERLSEDEVREHYVDQLLKKSIQSTVRIFYLWRNYLANNPYMFDHATLALNYLIKSKSRFTRDQGVAAFQTLIYCLQDIINSLKMKPENILMLAKEYNYMALLLDAIAIFINEFNFTWRDSLESICVMNLAFEFLSIPTWPTKLVVKGLKLVNISIAKYLTPNMALLIDNVRDSTMSAVGPLLYAKLHDPTWEIRDSALEVLCTISHNAFKKFPSFRNIVLDADLPSLILKMALLDGESFVRATAVKCLQEMVKLQAFWNNLLESSNVHEKIIQILQHETEGIVRCEAASLVVDIYKHRDIPIETLTKYYDIMTHAATADLHWEVKVNALKFWESVIQHHLTHQGMIDGCFPKVTFSKEHRKIVTLNEPEVRKRLIKILHQLSETGCLAVLITTLQDDCDLEVSKTATAIIQKFSELLKNYKVHSSDTSLSTPPSPLGSFNVAPSPPYSNAIPGTSTGSSLNMSPMSQLSDGGQQNSCANHFEDITDSILDEIINSQDMCLLQDMYNPSDQMSNSSLKLRFRRVMTPSDFLRFVDTDLDAHANDKAKWLRGMDAFESLLDDILKEYNSSDVNSMDCY
ncbi:uncharacterized protein LOC108911272 [Anoplophora glabripennis]|uniref:uncharacterized protein LOC108911272 n=1 Tax=Anoplophora glabripennis TaxID=217634 RepID=UPI00087375BA|nr:uncharacterized protein LOC108911272 [Anoplophora glabripennis]